MSELTGSAVGPNRSRILDHALSRSVEYYGEKPTCITVTLTNEATHGDEQFDADWTAKVTHHMDKPKYGPAKCIHCGKGNP